MSQGTEGRQSDSAEDVQSEDQHRAGSRRSPLSEERPSFSDEEQRQPVAMSVRDASVEAKQAVVSEALQTLPPAQRAGVRSLLTYTDELAEVDTSDPQRIAAASTNILNSYYTVVLQQSRRSFYWALIAAGVGLIFFLGAVAFLLIIESTEVATVSIIGGAVIEVISGLNFYLYGKATTQLADYRRSLEQTQRFLLANSISDSLAEETRDKSRADLVSTIAQWGHPSPQSQESKSPSRDQESKEPPEDQESRRRGSRLLSPQDQGS
jgi:hypothetical protein